MYIKQVTIQGFRSYKDKTEAEPFSPRHNVVVGRNGSGKSNFFAAIQFVLSDEFSHMRSEERQALLHEGTGQRVLSALVEIKFDNSDGRLPIDKEEVILQRVIGAKKDQYLLDSRLTTRTEVMNLLESAGFSRSNPYYIVKQGKINQIATAPDTHRLKLLKEVAGTKVYDERKEESQKILQETMDKTTKIVEMLRVIEDKLTTLETEKEELSEYQKWDKTHRALEYTIHEQGVRDARTKLAKLLMQKGTSEEETTLHREQLAKCRKAVELLEVEVEKLKAKSVKESDERDQLNRELHQLFSRKARMDLEQNDMEEDARRDVTAQEEVRRSLQAVKEKIATAEADLSQTVPAYQKEVEKERKGLESLSAKEQERKALYAKQGRGSQFSSKEERDQWINKEIRSLDKSIKHTQDQSRRMQQDVSKDEAEATKLATNVENLEGRIEKHGNLIKENSRTYHDSKREKDKLVAERNDMWRKESTLQQEVTTIKDELYKQEQSLRSVTGKAVLNGIDSVNKVIQRLRDNGKHKAANGYHGLLIHNFKCETTYYTCVEVTAGNRLFYHVVDSDDTSTEILSEMNQLKLPGEVSFMPLNRLLDKRLPNHAEREDALPMIQCLQYDQKYVRAINHVFGSTLICQTMEVGTELARSKNMDCITLEGDQVSRRGALTGGYLDNKKSRLELQRKKEELEAQKGDKKREYDAHKEELASVEAKLDKQHSDMQKMEARNLKNKENFEKMRKDLRLNRESVEKIEGEKEPQRQKLAGLQASLSQTQTARSNLMAEMGTELQSSLSADDQGKLDQLNEEIQQLTKENKKTLQIRSQLENRKNGLENKLATNLRKRKATLQAKLEEVSEAERGATLLTHREELDDTTERIEKNEARVKELEEAIRLIQGEMAALAERLEMAKGEESECQSSIAGDTKELDRMSTKESLLMKKRDEAQRKISQLGTLPTEAFEKYQNMDAKQLFRKLEKCNQELKKYSHVNKKALEQYMTFTEQRRSFIDRKKELDEAHSSIEGLMQSLDHRKYEAIEFTFKQVSKYFTEIFKYLVPMGKGFLVMRKGADMEEEGVNGQHQPKVMQISGVGIRVSFTGEEGEMKDMQQLSGGQKSLVALTLIFAIQKCDPAPFYLFDEIDQALDAQHRKAVADMIHSLCGEAQFITTTFRPELLEKADKFYGVKFRNKVSHVDSVSLEEARDFVEDDATHA